MVTNPIQRDRIAERLTRRLGLDANPLRRAMDRAEAWIRIGVLLGFLAAAPFAAIMTAHMVYRDGLSESRAQIAHSHRVQAVLLAPAGAGLAWTAGDDTTLVSARWTGTGGVPRTGQVLAPPGAAAGSSVTIWVTPAGAVTSPPLLPGQVACRAVAAAVFTPVLLGIVLLTALCLTGTILDRRRLANWETGWLRAEPRWTSGRS